MISKSDKIINLLKTLRAKINTITYPCNNLLMIHAVEKVLNSFLIKGYITLMQSFYTLANFSYTFPLC